MLAKVVAHVKSTTKGTPINMPEKGNDSKKRKLTDPIPWKTKPEDSGRDAQSWPDKKQKLCQYCEQSQWSKSSMNTHDTEDCRKWNPDGKSKYSRKNKHANQHIRESSDIKACFAHMYKDNKKLQRKLSSENYFNKSKRKKYYSSSDFSPNRMMDPKKIV